MKVTLRSMLVALATAVAAGAMASAAAAAAPELSSAPPTPSYPTPTSPYTYVAKGGAGKLAWQAGAEWKYGKSSGTGELTSPTNPWHAHNKVEEISSNGCVSKGEKERNLVLNGDERFAYLNKAKNEVGLVLETEPTECTQLGTSMLDKGSVIATVSPVNTPTTKLTVSYKQADSFQEPDELEESKGTMQLVQSVGDEGPFENLGLEMTEYMEGFTKEGKEIEVDLDAAGGTPSLQSGLGNEFKLSGTSMKFVSKDGVEVKCPTFSGTGEFTSTKEGKITLDLTGCKGPLSTTCTVNSKELKSLLVYTYPSKETAEGRETGLLLSPASGSVFAELECAKVKSVTTGSLIAGISPLGKLSKTFALTLGQSGGVQAITEYENEKGEAREAFLKNSVEGGAPEESGLSAGSPKIELNGGWEEKIT